jgi:hypothetical protein
MKSKSKAKLFSLEVFLNKDGNVEMNYETLNPDTFEREMNIGLPMYSGTSQVASLLRYLRKSGDDIMSGSGNYI